MRFPALAVFAVLATTGLAGCGSRPDPCTLDRDADGLFDCAEERGWEVVVDLILPDHSLKRVARHVDSDPTVHRTDGAVPDGIKRLLRLDPRSTDTDADGLSDCVEVYDSNATWCQDPSAPAAVHDGGMGTDATKASSSIGYSRYLNSRPASDETGTLALPLLYGDGITDGAKVAGLAATLATGAAVTFQLDPRNKDFDGDGLEDAEEVFVYGSNPKVADTDGDGCGDGTDPAPSHAQRLDLGLERLRLNVSSGPVRVHFLGVLGGQQFRYPAQGSLPVGGGNATPIDAVVEVGAGACQYPPWAAWIDVDVRVVWTDAPGGARLIDVASGTVPSGNIVYWDPHGSRFALGLDGKASFAGPLRLDGREGSLDLRPRMALVPPSALEAAALYSARLQAISQGT